MPRATLDIPLDALTYIQDIRVRLSDVNLAKHVGNDAMVRLFSDVRSEFWLDAGIVEVADARIAVIVADLSMVYRAESHQRDVLRFAMGMANVNKYGADVVCRVTRVSDGADIALAKSGFVFFDYAARNVTSPPESFTARYGGGPD